MKDHQDSGKLIAIVEDDPDVARIIEQVLRDFAFRTVWHRRRHAAPPAHDVA